jgi:hypothetical protein
MRRVVKPSGRILLAELTPDGFALVARVHESEGRVHPVGPVTVSLAVEWFVSNGFRLLGLLLAQATVNRPAQATACASRKPP